MSGVRTITASMVAEVEGGLKLWTDEGVVMLRLPRAAGAAADKAEPRTEAVPVRLRGGRSAGVRARVARAIDMWADEPGCSVMRAMAACGINKEAWDYHTRTGGSLHEAKGRAELARRMAKEAA